MTILRSAILGIGTAAPERAFSQEDALALALELSPPENDDLRRQVELIYRRSGVEHRGTEAAHSVSLEPNQACASGFAPATLRSPNGPGTSERMAIYARRATDLALRSTRAALTDSGVGAEEITHLVTASCTGFASPGWDFEVVEALGLPRQVQRTNIGFMGCHAAINALRVAGAFSAAEPAARVLVCCTEVCSVHFRYAARPDQVVANALFADGSGAAVIGEGNATVPRIASTASRIFEGTLEQMGWAVGDHGFEMNLGIELPGTIRRSTGDWMRAWLGEHGHTVDQVRSWVVHPGGPKILTAAAEALSLPSGSVEESKRVLAAHGNMSSATVLFILDSLKTAGNLQLPCVVMSFGPGVTAEALLLT